MTCFRVFPISLISFFAGLRACRCSFALLHSNAPPAAAYQSNLFSSSSTIGGIGQNEEQYPVQYSLEGSILNRYACKRFRRFDGKKQQENNTTDTTASVPDPSVLQKAVYCLDLARRTPTAFNTQPFKVVMVHSPEQKLALSHYCLGPNAARIRDSDCTAIFLADRQVLRSLSRYRRFVAATREGQNKKPLSRRALWTMQFYIAIFSSGYPLPRLLASPITFCVRTAMAILNFFTSWFYPLPSLGNAETWASKQTTMVAMTYILACTSLGLATIPMEGFNGRGIRRVIRAPSRYAIPIIVGTGLPHKQMEVSKLTDRYPLKEVLYGDTFGKELNC